MICVHLEMSESQSQLKLTKFYEQNCSKVCKINWINKKSKLLKSLTHKVQVGVGLPLQMIDVLLYF